MEHSALILRRLFIQVFALLLIASLGSTELHGQAGQPEPYFSLSSDRTFKSDQQPTIHLYASNVRSLEFRVYRVKDPLAFFMNLEDLHSFGGRAPRLPQNLTLIERYHLLKRDLRFRVQNIFRAQYTKESRAVIRDRMEKQVPAPATAKVTPGVQAVEMYPAIPLLNPQQVVAVWNQPISTVRRWDSQTVPFEVPGKGVYLVEATEGTLRAYTIVVVTDIAVISKASSGRVVTFAADRVSGAPLPDSQIWMVLGGKTIAEGRSDMNGMFEKTLTATEAQSMLVLARKGDDFAVTSEFGFAVPSDPDQNLMGYIYAERPIYRPTHTVYFKGILRAAIGEAYILPARKQIDVEIQDPEGNPAFRKTLPLSPAGTFHGEFTLPVSAALGNYSITANPGQGYIHGSFEVEEYKKPEYDVKVTPDKNRVLQGEAITAVIEARYFFGEPVSDGKVTYVVHTSPYWYFPQDEEFDEFDSGGEYDDGGDQIDEQKGQLDADGKLRITIPTKVVEGNRSTKDVRYRIEARVTDQGNREITGSSFVVATYASFVLNVDSDKYVHDVGSTGKFLITAQDYEKRPIETDLQVELTRWQWQDSTETVLWSTTARTNATGQATVEVPLRDAGSFRIKARARSPENRDVVGVHYAWVTGVSTEWVGSGRERVQVIPDKASYAPGETARVLIVTGVPDAYVLVTTEGRSLQSPRVIHATSPTLTVDVPIRAESVPNFFVSAAFLHDNEFYQGSKSIKVPPAERQLTVEVQPSKAEFKPAEAATYLVTTKDYLGKPVSAEVSFGLVDEAIYAIRPEAAQDIMKFFYGTTYNRVSTTSSLSYYFNGAAGKRQMRLTELRPSTAFGQIKPEKLLQPKVRKAFPDTAIWVADLKTDNNGQATVRVNFPDALTTWRATARAVTNDTKVGSAVQKTIVRKNLILRLSVPRFFRQGDEVVVSVLVHNYLQNEKTARVSLEATGLQILEGATKDVMIPSRADAKLDWRVKAGNIGDVKLLGKALTDEESDAMELTLPVVPFGVKLSTSSAGSIPGTSEFNTTVTFPKSIDPASRSLEIGITPSVAGAIFGGLDYLTSFPYGCTEQTMSSFLPNVVVANALKQLNVKSNVDEAALTKKIRDGLARLYQYQHDDGGWGWWETDDSMDFMTAYVVAGLSQARDAGVNVDMGRLDNASMWLAKQFDSSPRVVADLRAYVLYALSLSGKATPARIDSVWNQRNGLGAYGLAMLGLTLDRANDNRVQEVVSSLSAQVKSDDREAYWPLMRDPLMLFEFDTTAEATAFALKLLVKRQPESMLVPKAALWLVNHRNEGFYWSTTKQTAMVIYGLTDYLKASGELKPNFSVQVFVNDRQLLTKSFTAADALSVNPPVIRIAAADLAAEENRIRIVKNGTGLLYWNTRGEYYSTEERLSRTGSISLNLLRDYFRLVPQRANEKIVYRLEPLNGPVRTGDVLAVRLTVSGGNWNYLQIEDPIPAGTEFIERDDLYELEQKPDWWARYFTRREFHDDRAAFFQTYFNGQLQHFYLLKVVNPGAFRASPARVQPMYQPQYLATTESRSLAVQQ